MGCCDGCMKFFLAAVNIVNIVVGLVLATAGILLIFKGHQYIPEVTQYGGELTIPCALLIGLGCALASFGSFACFAVSRRGPCALSTVFYIILMLTIAELVAVIIGSIKKDTLSKGVMGEIETWFNNVNSDNATELQLTAVSFIQLTLNCCGLEGGVNFWTMWDMQNKVPASCCGLRARPTSASYYCDRFDPLLEEKSCRPLLEEAARAWLVWVAVGSLGLLVVINLLVMVCAKRIRRYEYGDEYVYTRYSNHDTTTSWTGKSYPPSSAGAAGAANSTWL